MKFEFTKEMCAEVLHGNSKVDEWYEALLEMLPKYEIDTVDRAAGFLAQCAHESLNFRVLEENLNYSAKALDAVFGKYFARGGRDANEYARQPEKIANVTYANRIGNGDTASGDGWRFRGRGVIQLTGRANYADFGKTIGMTADEVIDYVTTIKGALESACWFWDTRNINAMADNQDIVAMSKKVNGGTVGLEDRKKHFKHFLDVLGGNFDPSKAPAPVVGILRVGAKGAAVMQMQEKLGIAADGDFGPGTEKAVKEWQTKNGLVADGIVGPKTLAKLME